MVFRPPLTGSDFLLVSLSTGVEIYFMPQVQLPIFPAGTLSITRELSFSRSDDQVVYFNGHLPVFTHQIDDLCSFRLFTTQLIINGTATQGDIVKAFGVPITTVKRCCKRFRERGSSAFFRPAERRQGTRLTPSILSQAQALLDQGLSVPAISSQLNVMASTLHKAIDDGRLRQIKKKILRQSW